MLASSGEVDLTREAIGARPEIQGAVAGRETNGFWPQASGVLQVVTVPITIGLDRPELANGKGSRRPR